VYGHEKALYGKSHSGILSVPKCNCVESRLSSLFEYLSSMRPVEENWATFLTRKTRSVDGPQEFISDDASSWLDGTWNMENLVACMHDTEEDAADLICENRRHIEPLKVRQLDTFQVTRENFRPSSFDGGMLQRTFASAIPPRTEVQTARPCHNSTSGDDWVPLLDLDSRVSDGPDLSTKIQCG
jgi:hypothetical protein